MNDGLEDFHECLLSVEVKKLPKREKFYFAITKYNEFRIISV
jgi:hypothetical protein